MIVNFIVIKVSLRNRKRWIISGVVVSLLWAPIATTISMLIIVYYTSNPFGAGAAGFAYGILLFVNGIIFLITALFSKTKGN
ncbi:hypothetical protein [Priestia endophytica]|uniref:hypothetical protein n=1 Tax=Priestia endophytica TaxID=135735 RepID=UPI000DCA4B2E|nr:hypothetical protein [Priestia endophytica]RAS77113.1 hypothetical protein A4U60_18225 [Priestia endophytica]